MVEDSKTYVFGADKGSGMDASTLLAMMNGDNGFDNYYIDNLQSMLLYGGVNWGVTYTNSDVNTSIIVIGKITNAEQFQNTFDHKKGHLATHITQIYNINPYGEKYQYLVEDIGLKLFKVAKQYLCDNCRNKLKIS